MGQVGGRDARQQLFAVLEEGESPNLRRAAMWSLALMRDGRTTSRLIKLLRTDPDQEIRTTAAYALGLIDGPRADMALRKALANTSEAAVVRGMAAEQLVYKRSAIPELLVGTRDKAPEVRFWSAYALGEGRVKRALPALRRLTKDRSRVRGWWSVAREAKWAIATIKAGFTGDVPDPWEPRKIYMLPDR